LAKIVSWAEIIASSLKKLYSTLAGLYNLAMMFLKLSGVYRSRTGLMKPDSMQGCQAPADRRATCLRLCTPNLDLTNQKQPCIGFDQSQSSI
jgi:hypothetical protein